jgi:NADH dehydrogenase (ubiquinone) Fe-S protein 1
MDSLLTNTTLTCSINDRSFQVLKGSTILQACEQSGFLIPRFCYHDSLSIAGNCRMCLVQLDKATKPVASCALEILPGMKVYTNTALVKRAREGVMEFLLANHPLDCPICDQGGECDLQDQALIFGNDRGRFYETKRSVADKDWGPLIKTVMTRCIHCTRCQRFSTELSGEVEVGMVGRGNKSEITNLLGNLVRSEVSANVIDLCPVGALTSKPYAFIARPWELTRFEGIDLTDSLASNLSFHVAHQRVVRILPVLHQKLNEEWLSNRARFVYDGFRLQRLTNPSVVLDDKLVNLAWSSALFSTLFSVGPFFSSLISFGELSLQAVFYVKRLSTFFFSENAAPVLDDRNSCFLQPDYSSISSSDLVVIAGVPLKRDLPLLLVRLRLEQSRRDLPVLTVGCSDLGLKTSSLGMTLLHLLLFLTGRHHDSSAFKKAKKPTLILSTSTIFSLFPNFSSIKTFCLLANSNVVFAPVPSAGYSFNNSAEVGLAGAVAFSSLPATFNSFQLNSTPNNFDIDRESTLCANSHGFDSLIRPNLTLLPVKNTVESTSYSLNLEGRLQVSRGLLSSSKLKSIEVVLLLLLHTISVGYCSLHSASFQTELVRNALTFSSFFVNARNTKSIPALPLFSVSASLYQTTPVTYVSPLLLKSASLYRSTLTSSFPTI